MEDNIKDMSLSELESFVETRIWRLMIKAAVDAVSSKMEANNQIDPFKDPTTICRNQGYIEGLNFLIDYPAVLKEQVEYERKKDEKEEKKDG